MWVFSSLCLSIPFFLNAQEQPAKTNKWYFGIELSSGASSVLFGSAKPAKAQAIFGLGLLIDYQLSRDWTIENGIRVQFRGTPQTRFEVPNSNGAYFIPNVKSYVIGGLSLSAQYTPKGGRILLEVGANTAYILNKREAFYNKIDLSAIGGIGYKIPIFTNHVDDVTMTIGFRGYYSLIPQMNLQWTDTQGAAIPVSHQWRDLAGEIYLRFR